MKFKLSNLILIPVIALLLPVSVSAQELEIEVPQIEVPELDVEQMLESVPPPPELPVDTPIDGGLGLLLAAGVGYGIKKVRDSRKAQKKNL